MKVPEGVSIEEWKEWRTSHVTKAVVKTLLEEEAYISGCLGRGEILNPENPTVTYGNAARVWGQLESLRAMIEFISADPEDYQ